MKYKNNNKFNLTKILICLLILSFLWFYSPKDKQNSYDTTNEIVYRFENNNKLNEHFEKHGKPMGFKNKEEYEKAASKVVNNPNALHKLESEDNDDVYYLEKTNEFVIVSKKGYIRTYFYPDSGKSYFDKQ